MRVLFNPIKSMPKIAAGTMLALATIACKKQDLDKEAEKRAIHHLTGLEYLQAQEREEELKLREHSEANYSENLAYWDSLRIEALANKAYRDGYKMVLDSAANKKYKKVSYGMPVDTTFNANAKEIRQNVIKDVAKNVSGAKLYAYTENEPKIKNKYLAFKRQFGDICVMHYYNLLTAVGKQREAYQKGAADAREKVKSMPKPQPTTQVKSKRRR